MNFFNYKLICFRICVGTFIVALLCFLLIFVGVPVLFRYSYNVQCNLLFLNFGKLLSFSKYGSERRYLCTLYKIKKKSRVPLANRGCRCWEKTNTNINNHDSLVPLSDNVITLLLNVLFPSPGEGLVAPIL